MKIHGITVSVGYADMLRKTLPGWITLNSITVVTTPEDKATRDVVDQFNYADGDLGRFRTFQTDIFYDNGASFNKGAAISLCRRRLSQIGINEWILLFDADVRPQFAFWRSLVTDTIEPGNLYGAPRLDADTGQAFNDPDVAGYFMLFNSGDPNATDALGNVVDVCWPHAGNYDTTFHRRWAPEKKFMLHEIPLIHYGQTARNWWGIGNQAKMDEMNKEALQTRWVGTRKDCHMIAYLGKPEIKKNILAQLRAHTKADDLIKGRYWEGGKGCAVGCTVHGSSHKMYEVLFGIPIHLARLEDSIFEGLPNGKSKAWPVDFMSAIKVGTDLSMVWPLFSLWLLTKELPKTTNNARSLKAIADVADMYREWIKTGTKPATERWRTAASSAFSAAHAAYAAYADAAFSAADAAYAAYAASSAYAAYAAAAAVSSAYAASFAYAADAAYAASSAYAARSEFWIRASNQLLEIIMTAPMAQHERMEKP